MICSAHVGAYHLSRLQILSDIKYDYIENVCVFLLPCSGITNTFQYFSFVKIIKNNYISYPVQKLTYIIYINL